jgi:hypothetical protein
MSKTEQSKATNRYLDRRRDLTAEEMEKARAILDSFFDYLEKEEGKTEGHEGTFRSKAEHVKESPLQRYNIDVVIRKL